MYHSPGISSSGIMSVSVHAVMLQLEVSMVTSICCNSHMATSQYRLHANSSNQ